VLAGGIILHAPVSNVHETLQLNDHQSNHKVVHDCQLRLVPSHASLHSKILFPQIAGIVYGFTSAIYLM
jgi:hypothetical protein